MNNISETISFARELVSHYSKLDKLSNCYTLSISDISEFSIYEFSALLMKEDSDYAMEATSIDNPAYNEIMLPALIKFMQSSYSKEQQYDFNVAWSKGIAKYHEKTFHRVLSMCLEDYNEEKGFINKYEVKHSDYMEVARW